ncbi:MAG: DUF5989 family protein [Ignavibacteria bacterium]|nr:DUF5989 family protein [Ignavibacteria bacterium]
MNRSRVIFEYLRFLKQEKRYWLIPVVVFLVLLGLLVVLFEGSAVAPFIYTIF